MPQSHYKRMILYLLWPDNNCGSFLVRYLRRLKIGRIAGRYQFIRIDDIVASLYFFVRIRTMVLWHISERPQCLQVNTVENEKKNRRADFSGFFFIWSKIGFNAQNSMTRVSRYIKTEIYFALKGKKYMLLENKLKSQSI